MFIFNRDKNTDANGFEDKGLGPQQDAEVDETVSSKLKGAINSKHIRNIALTGPYGSGKSTVIRSCCKTAVYVSLAEFDFAKADEHPKGGDSTAREGVEPYGGKVDEPSKGAGCITTAMLEEKVISQIASYANRPKARWKGSSFPSKQSLGAQRVCTLLAICFIVVALLAGFAIAAILPMSEIELQQRISFAVAAAAIVLILGLVFLIVYLVAGMPPLISKLSINSVSFEVVKGNPALSFFDSNLPFILNLFDSRREDVYVFEDLDRLGDDSLFVRLRELNTLVNNHLFPRVVTFVYCVSDSITSGYGRTKFFDYIIPIIPYLDGYNSYGTLCKELGNETNRFDGKFLRNVASYLDDNRLLVNTVHEYRIYEAQLNDTQDGNFGHKELLSLMVIKNMNPRAFELLQRQQGKLYEVLTTPVENAKAGVANSISVDEQTLNAIIKDVHLSAEAAMQPHGGRYERDRLKDFIGYAVNNGYIDEAFSSYISFRDDKALPEEDFMWLRRARNGTASYEYEIKRPDLLLLYMQDQEFRHPAALNYSLCSYVLDSFDGNAPITESIMETLQTPSGMGFAREAVSRAPAFAKLSSEVNAAFASNIEGLDMGLYAIELSATVSATRFESVDKENEGKLSAALVRRAGSTNRKDLGFLEPCCEHPEHAIAGVISRLDLRVDRIGQDCDDVFLKLLLDESLYVQNVQNCQELCRRFGGRDEHMDLLDHMRESDEALVWSNARENPDEFIADFFAEGETTDCSESTFLELANLEMSPASRCVLFDAYNGTVSDVDSLEDTGSWDDALRFGVVKKSTQNMTAAFLEIGASANWVSYANDEPVFVFEKEETAEGFGDAELEKIAAVNGLDNGAYRSFVSCIPQRSLPSIPSGIEEEKVQMLFDLGLVSLTRSTLNRGRQLGDKRSFYSMCRSDVEGYVSNVSMRSSEANTEIPEILKDTSLRDEDKKRLVNHTSCMFNASAYKEDLALIKIMLDAGRVQDMQFALGLYGEDAYLDESIRNYCASQSIQQLKPMDPSLDLVEDLYGAVQETTNPGRLAGLMELTDSKYGNNGIRACLSARIDTLLAKTLDNRRPSYEKCSAEEKKVADYLISVGWMTRYPNGNLQLLSSKKS